MRLLVLAIGLVSGISAHALTADKDVVVIKKEEPKQSTRESYVENGVLVSPRIPTAQGLSAENREGKKFTVVAQAIGFGPSRTFGSGLTFGYYFNPSSVLLLEFTSGQDSGLDDVFDHTDVKSKSVGIHLKQFVGNSFYVRGGFDYRTVDYKYRNHFFADEDAGFKGKSFGASFYIGNQWQWENFTLGCDWVGVTIPFGDTYKNEYATSNTSPAHITQRLADDEDYFGKEVALNLVRFYLGASF